MALAVADLVENEITGDGEQPCGEFGGGLVTVGGAPDTHKNLVSKLFCIRRGAGHAGDDACDAGLIFENEFAESLLIAVLNALHPREVTKPFGISFWGWLEAHEGWGNF